MSSRSGSVVLLLSWGCASEVAFGDAADKEQGEAPMGVPGIALSPERVDFGTWSTPTTLTGTVTIESTGDADLQVSSVLLSGASAFSLLEPFASTLPAGEQLEMVVGYTTGEAAAEHTATLEVRSDAPDQPLARVELVGRLVFEGIDSGIPEPEEEPEETCECPEGFEVDETGALCVSGSEVPATAVGQVMRVCEIEPYPDYNKFGVLYPDGTNVRDAYWGQSDGEPNGRLNAVGVWPCDGGDDSGMGTPPMRQWVGFSACVDVDAAGDYLFGVAGDNRVLFAVDGHMIIQPFDDSGDNFNYWHIDRIRLTEGPHVLTVHGYNEASIAGFGAELVGPFPEGSLTDDAAMQAADYAGSIVWDTHDAIELPHPSSSNVSWVCPEGMELSGCGSQTCVGYAEVPCE